MGEVTAVSMMKPNSTFVFNTAKHKTMDSNAILYTILALFYNSFVTERTPQKCYNGQDPLSKGCSESAVPTLLPGSSRNLLHFLAYERFSALFACLINN